MDLISLFNSIRDIPYKIPLKWGEQDYCCSGKHIRLLSALLRNGYQARYRVCVFFWSDLNLPKDLEKVSHDDDSTHVWVELFLNNKWVTVDATWDEGLKEIFTVNDWDGKSNTVIAVKPRKIFSPEKSAEIMADQNKEVIDRDLEKNGKFYEAFNNWLAEVRNK
jgi:hypothetical protein